MFAAPPVVCKLKSFSGINFEIILQYDTIQYELSIYSELE